MIVNTFTDKYLVYVKWPCDWRHRQLSNLRNSRQRMGHLMTLYVVRGPYFVAL